MMKPYRIINGSEQRALYQQCSSRIESWNKEYSMSPVSLQIAPPSVENPINKGFIIHSEDAPLAIMEEHYLNLISEALFADIVPCCKLTCYELAEILLSELFNVPRCTLGDSIHSKPRWLYPGTTCLQLRLICQQNSLNLLLNPDWVYQNLPQEQPKKGNLCSLEEAVANNTIALNTELVPISLPIKQIINLQPGDLIATDHPLSTPLSLTLNEAALAQVELGQSSDYKSIIIKRSS